MKRILVILAMALPLMAAYAQIGWSIEAGYNLTPAISKSPVLNTPLNGAHIGGTMSYQFRQTPAVGFNIGLAYQFAAANNTLTALPMTTYDELTCAHSLLLPVRFTFTHAFTDNWSLFVLAGPQLAYNWYSCSYNNLPATAASPLQGEWETDVIPFDCSLGIGIGAQYKHVFLSASYDQGLFNRIKNNAATANMYNLYSRTFSLSVGYKF